MNTFNYLSVFNKKHHSADSIIKEIDSLLSTDELNVRVIPFGCVNKSIDWFDGKTIKDRTIKLLWKDKYLSSFSLVYKYKENNEERKNSGQFFVLRDSEYDDVFIALTIESSIFYRRALLPLIQSMYPSVLMTFITHKKLHRLLDNFKVGGNYSEIIITRASQRLRFQGNHEGRRFMPIVSWPSMSIDEAFNWVHEHNGWFESLSLDVKSEYRSLANITFTRQGVLRTNSLLERVFNSFVKPVCKTIHENIELFSHRSRLERSDLKPRPIVIDFEEDQFAEVAENQRFIQSMRRLRTASISVLHGNPYVHLSILDYFDGSAFDLWILDQKQLVLVPQLKGSVAAIKRLINHIFDDYAEGNLTNYEEVG